MAGDQPTHHRVGDDADLGIDGLSQVSVVGSGGSSTVYRAQQVALDRGVAVKVVHAAWSMETRERFEHERRVMGRLSGHSAVVPIFETGITRRGEPFLIMAFYPGGSLFRLMKDRGPLPWREATFLMEALAAVVADCHREGIVHRDIKPGNVMLTRHLQPRLADFGITQPVGAATSGSGVAYTPSYSPPEAFTGAVTATTIDVYGLGATLWALLAGRAPFTDGDGPIDGTAIMERAAKGDIGDPSPGTPEPLVRLIQRAMAPDAAERPADGADFAAELRRAVRLSEQAGPRQRPGWPTTAHLGPAATVLAVMVVAGVVCLAGGAAWLLLA